MTVIKKIVKARRRLSHLPNETDPPMKMWIQPQVQASHNSSGSRNLNCEICFRLASYSSDVLHCVYCNVVCHVTCLQQFYSKVRPSKRWVCFLCVDELDHSRQYYENDKLAVWEHELRIQAQITISKYWRRYKCRKFYLRIYTIIVQLQVMYNIRRRKRAFLFNTQAKLRPMKLHINHCHNLTILDREATKANQQHIHALQVGHHGSTATPSEDSSVVSKTSKNSPTKPKKREYEVYILVTVIDQSRGETAQTWRLIICQRKMMLKPNSTFDVHFDEYIMLGGISGFNVIVLTVFQKGFGRDIILGQVGIDLSDNYIWRKGGKFDMKLSKQDFEIKDNIGMDMKVDHRAEITGDISFELTSYRGMSSECGYCQASNAEDIIRSLARLPDVPGYDHGLHGQSSLMKPHANAGRVKAHGMAMASNNLLSTFNSSQNGSGLNLKKTWIAIAEGFIFVYSHFGDQMKIAVDLTYFYYSFEFKGKNVIYHLIKPGFPPFSFHPIELSENLRWKCAFLSSSHFVKAQLQYQSNLHAHKKEQHVANQVLEGHGKQELENLEAERGLLSLPDAGRGGEPGSGRMSGRTSGRSELLKFDVDSLIADLLVMEAMRPKYIKSGAGTSRLLTELGSIQTNSSASSATTTTSTTNTSTNTSNGVTHTNATQVDKPFSSHSSRVPNAKVVHSPTAKSSPAHNKNVAHGNVHSKSTPILPPLVAPNHTADNVDHADHGGKSLMSYKPKLKEDLGLSLRVEIPALSQGNTNLSSMRQKVLSSVLRSASADTAGSLEGLKRKTGDDYDDDTIGEEALKEQVVEAYDMDDVVVNEKYQEYGEQLVSKLMTKVAESNIRPLHNTPKHANAPPKSKQ